MKRNVAFMCYLFGLPYSHAWLDNSLDVLVHLHFLQFSHLADALIQSDLQ